ncbi:hypothetical protein [Mucilaginibacter sp.]
MKTLKVMIAICFIAVFTQKTIAQSTVSGLYLTAEDYHNQKLSFKTTDGDGNSIRFNEFLGSDRVVVVYNGKKQTFYKSAVYGYRSNNSDYRYFNNIPYKVIDDRDFYLYSSPKMVQQGKWSKPVDSYYFSSTAIADIKSLSIKNLQSAYTNNPRFRYLIESHFETDNALTAYDSAVNEYKVKYLYEHSTSM